MQTSWGERAFVLGVAALLALFMIRAGFLLYSPYTSDYGEGTVWTYAHLLRTRGTYFLPIADQPWIHGTYPPLFPRLHALLGGSLAAGRSLALVGTLLAAASIAGILRKRGVSPQRALLWGGLFLVTPAAHTWAALCRVDTLALGLSLLGLYLAERRRGWAPAAVCFAAAFFTKQIALAAPAATFFSLWLSGRKRDSAIFAATYGTIVLASFAIIDWRSGGEAAKHLIVYTGFPGLALGELLSWLLRFGFTFPVLLPFALVGLRESWRSPIGVYLVMALGTLVLTGKPGATGNYLLEPAAACVLAAAIAVEQRLSDSRRSPERRADYALLLTVQLFAICEPTRPMELGQLYATHKTGASAVAALNEVAPGPVLCEDLGLALAAGREPMLEPFQFGLLAQAGMFDPKPVVDGLQVGAFAAVLEGWRLRGFSALQPALQSRYERAAEVGPYELWVPRSTP